jgi:hypothetical protein
MAKDYKEQLNKLVEKKKKEIPTAQSDDAIKNIFETLEETPRFLIAIAKRFDEKTSLNPIIEGKRSFRETLVHLLNIEGLNYTTIYPAFLLNKPKVYPLHAEKDFDRLSLFTDFKLKDLLQAFDLERKKTLSFLRSLKPNDWIRQLVEDNKARQETIYWRARGLAVHDYTHVHILKFQMDL